MKTVQYFVVCGFLNPHLRKDGKQVWKDYGCFTSLRDAEEGARMLRVEKGPDWKVTVECRSRQEKDLIVMHDGRVFEVHSRKLNEHGREVVSMSEVNKTKKEKKK